ncbi:hypothetical protein SCANM63S_04255 [Streptomyces canarius]
MPLDLPEPLQGQCVIVRGAGMEGLQEAHGGRVPGIRLHRQPFARRDQVVPRRREVAAQQADAGPDDPGVDLMHRRFDLVLQAFHGDEVGLGVVELPEPQTLMSLGPQQHALAERAVLLPRRPGEQALTAGEVVQVLTGHDLLGQVRGIDRAEGGEQSQGFGGLAGVERRLTEPEQCLDVCLAVADRDGLP